MHERSLVKGLIEQVFAEAKVRQLGRVYEIQLQIGEFSGVEPRLVELAFAEMAPDHWDREIRLTVEVVPLAAVCNACNERFPVKAFIFVCPQCGGKIVDIVAGEEMQLVSLRAERRSNGTENGIPTPGRRSSC